MGAYALRAPGLAGLSADCTRPIAQRARQRCQKNTPKQNDEDGEGRPPLAHWHSFDDHTESEYSPSGPPPRDPAVIWDLFRKGIVMGTLKSLMYFATCWALAGSLSAAEDKVPVDKLEPKVSPNSAAVKASNDFACDLYRSLDQENRTRPPTTLSRIRPAPQTGADEPTFRVNRGKFSSEFSRATRATATMSVAFVYTRYNRVALRCKQTHADLQRKHVGGCQDITFSLPER